MMKYCKPPAPSVFLAKLWQADTKKPLVHADTGAHISPTCSIYWTNCTCKIHIGWLVIVHVCHVGVLLSAWADVIRQSLRLFLENRKRCQMGFFLIAHAYALPYIMHVMHLCYAKEAWWKEIHHWEMEIRWPLLFPAVISADERCSSAHLGKIPSTPVL